jgi:hypothetical protein
MVVMISSSLRVLVVVVVVVVVVSNGTERNAKGSRKFHRRFSTQRNAKREFPLSRFMHSIVVRYL